MRVTIPGGARRFLMGRFGIAVLLIVAGFPAGNAFGQAPKGVRYQRVYGATNHAAAPVQPSYQHHAHHAGHFHGHGIGAHVYGAPGACLSSYGYNAYFHHGGCGLGLGGIVGVPGYSVFASYTAPVPPVIYGYPPVVGYHPLTDPVLKVPRLRGDLAVNTPEMTEPLPPISTPEARLKSLRAQAQGDNWLRKQEFYKAYDRYKAAVDKAPDRGEAHLRLAIAYLALGQPDQAVRQLKRGLAVDPKFTAKAEPLSKIYGENNAIAQSAMVHKATLWVKEDIRDPDRLFLLGTLLYLQGDERAKILLETGLMLSGGDHFREILAATQTHPLKAQEQADAGKADADPPQPDAPKAGDEGVLPPLPAPPVTPPDEPAQNPPPAGPALGLPLR